jgi:hypothetical protein
MTGKLTPYRKAVPFNVTRLAGLTTTIIGRVGRGDDQDVAGIARGDSETWRQVPDVISAQKGFEVNRIRVMAGKKHLLGAVVMGDQTLSKPLQDLIVNQADITPILGDLIAQQVPLLDLLLEFWEDWKVHHEPQ